MIQIQRDTRFFSPVIRTINVGMDSKFLNYVYAHQRGENWCWAACIEMITKYYGVHIQQEYFAKNHCGIDAYGNVRDCPAPVDVITQNLNWCYKTHCIETPVFRYRPDEDSLIKLMNADMPVVIAYRYGVQIGHAVVLTGMTYVETMFGTELSHLIVRDPSPTAENLIVSGRRVFPAPNALLNSVYAWWVPTVKKHFPHIPVYPAHSKVYW